MLQSLHSKNLIVKNLVPENFTITPPYEGAMNGVWRYVEFDATRPRPVISDETTMRAPLYGKTQGPMTYMSPRVHQRTEPGKHCINCMLDCNNSGWHLTCNLKTGYLIHLHGQFINITDDDFVISIEVGRLNSIEVRRQNFCSISYDGYCQHVYVHSTSGRLLVIAVHRGRVTHGRTAMVQRRRWWIGRGVWGSLQEKTRMY